MENINKLSTVGYYAFENGDILDGQALQGIRDKINEIIDAFNAQFGNGGSSSGGDDTPSGGGSGSEEGTLAPYMYMAARMLTFDQTPGQINYNGEIYVPTSSDAFIKATMELYVQQSTWEDNYWRVHDYRNVCVMRGRTTISDNGGNYAHSLYTYWGNPQMYENPGKWLGNKYVFSASTQVQDSLYGIQCFLKDDKGWITEGEDVNHIVVENKEM